MNGQTLKRLRRRMFHRTEDGQALFMVLGIITIVVLLATAVELSLADHLRLQSTTTRSEEAVQAADTGLANFESWVSSSTGKWYDGYTYCSKGSFTSGCGAKTPNSHDPAYVGKLNPGCSSTSSTYHTKTPGASNYRRLGERPYGNRCRRAVPVHDHISERHQDRWVRTHLCPGEGGLVE